MTKPNYGEIPLTVIMLNHSTGATIPPLSGAPVGASKNVNFGEIPMTVVIVDPATGLPVTY